MTQSVKLANNQLQQCQLVMISVCLCGIFMAKCVGDAFCRRDFEYSERCLYVSVDRFLSAP